MVIHYFTLLSLAERFSSLLHGSRIEAIFSQQKGELAIHLSDLPHESRTGRDGTLVISIDPAMTYAVLRERMPRARKNSVDLFPEAIGRSIRGVRVRQYDRIVHVDLSDGYSLLLFLYNTAGSNILLVDAERRIHSAFKRQRDLQDTLSAIPDERFDARLVDDADGFRSLIASDPGSAIYGSLKRAIPILGSTYAREILHRIGVGEETPTGRVNASQLEEIRLQAAEMIHRAAGPRTFIYHRESGGIILSVVPLTHLADARVEIFDDANEAVRVAIGQSFRSLSFDGDKRKLSSSLKSRLDQVRRVIASLDEELQKGDRAGRYDRFGKIVMANLQHLTKGTREIDLPDPFEGGSTVRLTLDPLLTPVQNAERYFLRAKKARAARSDLLARVEDLEKRKTLLETMLLHLDHCEDAGELKEFRATYGMELPGRRSSGPADGQAAPFRVFSVGGCEVLVGKSSESNDLLTMKYARPHDLWFHARGASGSHTLLRITAGTMPPPGIIRQAAQIAAYYSKMRKAGNVPVAYCERRHLRKPKGAPRGSMIMERETVLFVEPRLP